MQEGKTLNETELEQLEAKREDILNYCVGWKKCQDGSYEMALDNLGFYEVIKRIAQLKGQLNA